MRMIEVDAFQANKRWTIQPRAIVRLSGGGPEYIGSDGQVHRLTLPGRWRVRSVLRSGRTRHRYFLEVAGVDRVGGIYTVLVSGQPYRSVSGLMIRPYRLKRVRPKKSARSREGAVLHGRNP